MCMPMMGEHVATPSVLAKVILLVGQLVLYLMSNLILIKAFFIKCFIKNEEKLCFSVPSCKTDNVHLPVSIVALLITPALKLVSQLHQYPVASVSSAALTRHSCQAVTW